MTDTYETPTSRIILLGLAFAALVAIGIVTVLRPELAHEPDPVSSVVELSDGVAARDTPPATPSP